MVKKLPKISIITPSYSQAKYLEETIQSVLSQNYSNLEFLIMDGGSKDGTKKILKKYDGKLKWTSKRDRGQTDAINKGLKIATGDIIAYLNSDDFYLPKTFDKVASFLTSNNYKWVTGKCQIVNHNGKQIRGGVTYWKNFWLEMKSKSIQEKTLLVLNYISQPATFWTREVLEKIGYFDQNLQYTMDYDYWLRIIRRFKLGVIPEDLAVFRVHPKSKGVTKTKDQFSEGLEVVRKYTNSKTLIALHKLHDRWTQYMYNS